MDTMLLLLNENRTAAFIILALAFAAWLTFVAALLTYRRTSFIYRYGLPVLAMTLLSATPIATMALVTYARPKAALFALAAFLFYEARHKLSELALLLAMLAALVALAMDWAVVVVAGLAYTIVFIVRRVVSIKRCMAESLENLSPE
jgi:hypothetical protein